MTLKTLCSLHSPFSHLSLCNQSSLSIAGEYPDHNRVPAEGPKGKEPDSQIYKAHFYFVVFLLDNFVIDSIE